MVYGRKVTQEIREDLAKWKVSGVPSSRQGTEHEQCKNCVFYRRQAVVSFGCHATTWEKALPFCAYYLAYTRSGALCNTFDNVAGYGELHTEEVK